jgi:hypothetical protein
MLTPERWVHEMLVGARRRMLDADGGMLMLRLQAQVMDWMLFGWSLAALILSDYHAKCLVSPFVLT